MKKLIFLTILLFTLNMISCNTIPYQKINYNTNNLTYLKELQRLNLETVINIKIIENKFYKEKPVEKEDLKIFQELFQLLDEKNIIKPLDRDTEFLYKIQITTDKKKYFIDVYGNDIISIYPFDGVNPKNFLLVNNLPLSTQPESICKYILNKQ